MQAARSKPPDSSTDASAAFQATACTLPAWCVSVWSHAPVVRSHTCNGGVSQALGLRSVLTDESASSHRPPSSGPTPAQRTPGDAQMSGLHVRVVTTLENCDAHCDFIMHILYGHHKLPPAAAQLQAGVHCMAEAPVLPLQQGGIGKC